jgi:hypothetical protein
MLRRRRQERAMIFGMRKNVLLLMLVPALVAAQEWQPLFDGKTLAGWKASDFFGAGKVTVDKGVITIGTGILTGITWAQEKTPFPAEGYEVRVEAARLKGHDFFAGITFPVGDSHCTWINGGWGGEVVGLSSIDGADASQNETTSGRRFETGVYYTFRLRVTPQTVTGWIGDEEIFSVRLAGKWIALREGDIDKSIPFGIATYDTVAGVRKIEWRPLPVAGAEKQ